MDVSISAGGNGGGGDLAHTRLLLDSALKYESARVNYYNLIKRKVRALKKLTTTFYNEDTSSSSSSSEAAATGAGGAGGVQMKDFGHDALQLSRRYECADYQVVLVVPEHSMQTRRCVETLREWLEYDRAYAKYHLPIDMVEIDKRRKSLNSIKSSTELIYTQLVYRLHLLKAPIEANEREMQEMYRKKDTTSTTTTTTTAATATATATSRMTMAVFADSSSYQQHKHATSRYASMECRQMLDEMNRELDKWEHEEVKINRAILALKPKQYMKINEIFIHIERVKSAVWWLDEQLVHLYQEKKVKQNDLDILDNCYLRLKEIHINKMSSEALGKIFYGLPMPTFKLNSTSNNCGNKEAATAVDSDYALALVFSKHFDPFDVYFKIVARGVSTHETWIRIYFELPFHPERGQENKQKDIDDLYKVNRSSSCRVSLFLKTPLSLSLSLSLKSFSFTPKLFLFFKGVVLRSAQEVEAAALASQGGESARGVALVRPPRPHRRVRGEDAPVQSQDNHQREAQRDRVGHAQTRGRNCAPEFDQVLRAAQGRKRRRAQEALQQASLLHRQPQAAAAQLIDRPHSISQPKTQHLSCSFIVYNLLSFIYIKVY